MSWKNYEVTIDVTSRHTIPVRAQSSDAAVDRALKVFEEGARPYEIQDHDEEVSGVREVT